MTRPFTITITFAWWFPIYINTLVFFCKIFDCEPDYERFEKIAARAIRIT